MKDFSLFYKNKIRNKELLITFLIFYLFIFFLWNFPFYFPFHFLIPHLSNSDTRRANPNFPFEGKEEKNKPIRKKKLSDVFFVVGLLQKEWRCGISLSFFNSDCQRIKNKKHYILQFILTIWFNSIRFIQYDILSLLLWVFSEKYSFFLLFLLLWCNRNFIVVCFPFHCESWAIFFPKFQKKDLQNSPTFLESHLEKKIKMASFFLLLLIFFSKVFVFNLIFFT